jgi:hypothetical protein
LSLQSWILSPQELNLSALGWIWSPELDLNLQGWIWASRAGF